MSDTITGSAQDVLDAFEADRKKWGNRPWLYNYPGIYPYMGMTSYYWCALQVVRCLLGAGFDLRKVLTQWGYCPSVEAYMAASPDWITTRIEDARMGDIALFKRNGLAYHIGIVAGPYSNGILPTAEGDTSSPNFPGSDSTGGVITYKTRYAANYRDGVHTVHLFRHAYLGKTAPAAQPHAAAAQAAADVLQVGSQGVRVAHLQAGLNKVFPAYCPKGGLAVDGSYGPVTAAAVKRFQAACKIAADGVVGSTTLSYLAKYGVKI